ncbi:MAG: reactive intermediate/imine deaminase [Crocinitomicaceae bacterium]|nr:reactive intermediate/imine deaminase [Crocinitomicaceae bacterium]|tara:strand:- start:7898 stop:8278 length:381 start_codon:yes stop_codon:yes gene_type:complete
MKKIITIKNAPEPVGPYSQAILFGNTLYSSGQIAIDPKTNNLILDTLEKETHQVMLNIGAILDAANMKWENIIKCSIFLSDMNNFELVNSIYASYFSSSYPARETVEVACLPKNVNVEISFIAIKE